MLCFMFSPGNEIAVGMFESGENTTLYSFVRFSLGLDVPLVFFVLMQQRAIIEFIWVLDIDIEYRVMRTELEGRVRSNSVCTGR